MDKGHPAGLSEDNAGPDGAAAVAADDADFAVCVTCQNSLEMCVCVCSFCGERDKCECALFDAATGG